VLGGFEARLRGEDLRMGRLGLGEEGGEIDRLGGERDRAERGQEKGQPREDAPRSIWSKVFTMPPWSREKASARSRDAKARRLGRQRS